MKITPSMAPGLPSTDLGSIGLMAGGTHGVSRVGRGKGDDDRNYLKTAM